MTPLTFPMTAGKQMQAAGRVTFALQIFGPLSASVVLGLTGRLTLPVFVLVLLASVWSALVLLMLELTAPKAIRVDARGLTVERRVGEVAIGPVDAAQAGPPLSTLGVRPLGLRLFGGIRRRLTLPGIGTVRVWAANPSAPTLLVTTLRGEQLLLGVDDRDSLLAALHAGRGAPR